MKRLITTLAIAGALLFPALALTVPAGAAIDIFKHSCSGAASSSDVCQSVSEQQKSGSNPVINVLKAAIETIAYITGALAIIFIIISGLRFITAAGSPEGVASARTSLIYALVGVAVSALAGSLVAFVLDNMH
ncbi:MAG TPA: hypothetical protein VN778_00710 [Verrucomicrobiae bacterium]|nr:hypothetical protein [Verrucomicrobiae bacterium]